MTLTRRRTKNDYLDTALLLANERSSAISHAYVVAHVDMTQVAKAAGVSRSALYRLWDTQESFRTDLAAYMAAHDDAPWIGLDPSTRPVGRGEVVPPGPAGATQDELGADPNPLLRAGIAGYPDASSLAAVIAERERWRLARHVNLVDRALRTAGRRCLPGLTPADISLVTNGVADGIALATRMTPPDLPLVVPHDSGRPRSLLTVAISGLFDGMSQPGPQPRGQMIHLEQPPRPPVDHRGRRLDYLRLAAELARRDHPEPEPTDSYALGYVSLDALARAEGVTRAAVRKLWPSQAAFRPDLFAHLLTRHRQAIVEAMGRAGCGAPGERLLRLGDDLFDQVQRERRQVSHLSFAPQFVLPSFRAYIHRHTAPLLDSTGAALAKLLRAAGRRPRPGLGGRHGAALVLAFVDGMTRVSRTLPELVREQVAVLPTGDHRHSLLAVAFEKLLLGSSLPLTTASADNQPTRSAS